MTEAAIRTKERGWIHASRIKGPVEELKEWTITSEPGDTKLTLKRGLGGKTPLKAVTVFTDGSGSSHKSVMTWKDTRTQKWESDVRVVEGSPQIAEMAAVVRALEKFKDQPFNLITDSAYKQTPKDHSEMRGSYRVTVMRMLLTLLMLLNIKAWKMGQPPENVWVTLAKTLQQDNLCLSMGSVSSPLSLCLVGIHSRSTSHHLCIPLQGTGLPCPPQKKDQPEKPGNSG
ncbi:hypothetical protein DUI87_35336 [Hirundo rustica rustica]|uniref:RNase H type-1 domain-containing protein n=1 Tax=Hirundo rustica rustica TaxID=333673 RepID=A0A3M0IGT3_HIRRU|nr:hypothetical protein DUI87_35336 [Hirundo rustica rustica]